jgi:hypothetical protein
VVPFCRYNDGEDSKSTIGTFIKSLDSECLIFVILWNGPALEIELNPLELIMIAVVVIAKNDHHVNSLKLISTWSKTGKCDQGASLRPRRQKSGLTKYPLQLALLV